MSQRVAAICLMPRLSILRHQAVNHDNVWNSKKCSNKEKFKQEVVDKWTKEALVQYFVKSNRRESSDSK